jgi:cytochrome c oxidase cbb3-type subunit 2
MNHGPLIFLGAFLVFASAWIGLVFMPNHQLKDLQATQVDASSITHPAPYTGQQLTGRKVYQSEGCVYCHTQQVRGGDYNNDIDRGWGSRRSNPQDYIYDYPVLLGTMRTGPDLANIASRQPSEQWHLTHLYDPQLISPGSVMAPFRYLFDLRSIVGQPSPDALRFDYVYVTLADDSLATLDTLAQHGFVVIDKRSGRYLGRFDPAKASELTQLAGVSKVDPYVPAGYEIVPTSRAKDLVAYLRSLDHTYPIVAAQPQPASTQPGGPR